MTKKVKPGRPSIFKRGLWHQDHAKINICILGDAMVVQRQNDQKIANHGRAKTQREWDELVNVAQRCPPLPKPALVKLTSQ